MKWFKHDGNARSDDKIEKLLMKYGVEGYGLYFYCVEIIAGNLSSDNINFELKHDAETIAYRLKMDTLRVEEIMRWMVENGLFQLSDVSGRIMCLGLLKRLDVSTSNNVEFKKLVASSQELLETNSNYQELSPEEKRREKKRREEGEEAPDNIPYATIIDYLNSRCNTKYHHSADATRRHISARWQEGFREDDFRRVIDSRADVWQDDDKMSQYLRPQTLFGTKFESYLNAAPDEKPDPIEWQAKKAQEGLIRFNNE